MKTARKEMDKNLREVIISMLGDELTALMSEEEDATSRIQVHNLAVVCNFLTHAARKNGDKELEKYAYRILKAAEA